MSYDGYAENGHFTLIDTIGESYYDIGDALFVGGGDGANCGAFFDHYTQGDTLVLALYDNAGEYLWMMESGCGEFYLKITNGENNGVSLAQIKQNILDITSDIKEVETTTSLTIFPNPTSDKLTIESGAVVITGVKLTDATGRILDNQSGVNTSLFELNLKNYSNGCYYVSVTTSEGTFQRKVIKQ